MRVTRIPGDFNDIGDRPCRVYLNEVEVTDWTVADDFRRVVISPGVTYQFLEDAEPKQAPDTVRYGAVRIDMAPESAAPAEEAATHLCGMFVVEPKPEAPAIEIVEAEPELQKPVAPTRAQPKARRKGRK
jgi:hypothetical protein